MPSVHAFNYKENPHVYILLLSMFVSDLYDGQAAQVGRGVGGKLDKTPINPCRIFKNGRRLTRVAAVLKMVHR